MLDLFNMSLLEFTERFGTVEACQEFLERLRWPEGPVCPHCGEVGRVYRLRGASTRPGLLKCAACRKQFTVTVGTIFEDSHIPLPKWFAAMYLMCASKKGISAHQLHRSLGLTYKSAWFLAHRIRHAMSGPGLAAALSGVVEVDEAYVGGKAKPGGKRGRGAGNKTAVVALEERGGRARVQVVERVDAKTLKDAILENVDPASCIRTDDMASYRGLGEKFEGGHETVVHGNGQYVKPVEGKPYASVNCCESYFSLLKRGLTGTFHHVSKHHLPRYMDEFSFRWDHNKIEDAERTVAALLQTPAKRLMYREAKGTGRGVDAAGD